MRRVHLPPRSTLWVIPPARPGADAEGVTFSTTSNASEPEIAMQFFSASQFPFANSQLPQILTVHVPHGPGGPGGPGKADCGWYDSSFDLAHGLDVCDADHNDTLYQLWELSRN
jgi:hypothetical protein